MNKRSVAVIGAPLDLGAGRRGVDMGPSALRVAGGAPEGPGVAHAWVALAAASLAPMIGAVLVLRGARDLTAPQNLPCLR